ncbi:GtrA family protein [Parabacteroides sp. FAFU027]|uniref:GtrA family protein n=1 Tax=Parabacteroides sp. FAFU027 TaxID=2922715 RepID=UPI001FAF9548|nr:GtrA family protein [Parabacteroides sp. FAFU027]
MKKIRDLMIMLIDWFYKPFQRLISIQTFRYGACGGANSAFDILLYFIFYHYLLGEKILHLGFIAISAHIASFLLVFPITFTTGFILGKFITFSDSELRGRTQLLRYGITVGGSILLNYIFLKLFVEYCHFFPTVSKMLTTVVVVTYSYFMQKYYSFKVAGNIA